MTLHVHFISQHAEIIQPHRTPEQVGKFLQAAFELGILTGKSVDITIKREKETNEQERR